MGRVEIDFAIWRGDKTTSLEHGTDSIQEVTSTQHKTPFYVRAEFGHISPDPTLLDFGYGDIIRVTKMKDDDWCFGECEGPTVQRNTGWFSKANHIYLDEDLVSKLGASLLGTTNSGSYRQAYEVTSSVAVSSKISSFEIERILENDYDFPENTTGVVTSDKLSSSSGALKNSWGMFRCEHPSCWDRKDKFRFNTFTELTRHYRDAHPHPIQNEWLPCDYPACRRAEDVFTRRDAYRDHLRDYHQEDIPRRHKSVKRE